MNEKRIVIERGSLFVLSSGEYSDYQIYAVCRAKCDIDLEALEDEYLASHPEQRRRYGISFYEFISWLIAQKQVAEELDYQEWYLGAYGLESELTRPKWNWRPLPEPPED